jgi:hypothetical protein
MMQLAVYLNAGHRALGKWKRDSCRLNYYIEGGSLLEWSRFAMTEHQTLPTAGHASAIRPRIKL